MSRPIGARSLVICTAWVALALGCAARPSFEPGDECELNTECSSRLVCRLGRCRTECRAERDCALGLECVRDPDGLGACQLPSEATCSLSSECPDFLVCRFGRCTNACERDVDCPPGARCEADESGMLGCRDASDSECQLNSDCVAPYICAPDLRCREPCRTDRDCRDGTVCLASMSPTMCGSPDARPDAGIDAGAMDGGLDAGALDAGTIDAGAIDAGMTAVGPGPPRMGGGFGHTCAAPTADDLRCWGANGDGQIGDGSLAPATTPYRHGLTGVAIITGGASHSCAVTASGLSCWGANDRGQLGTGTAGGRSTTPVATMGLPAVPTDLGLGSDHSCAIAASRLFCWGDNASGQLGTGATSMVPNPTPIELTLPATPVQITAFGSHSCVLLDDGRVLCWGENGDGQVGTGTTGADVPTPTEVVAARGASHVIVGTTHTCAIVGASVLCWGNNNLGQLGDGTMGPSRGVPRATSALAGAPLGLALGGTHSCVRTAAQVLCWGDNFSGQGGSDSGGATGWRILDPTPVASLGGPVDEIVCGSNHTCARDGARIRCWGSNLDDQLGSPGGDTFTARAVTWAP